MEEGGRCWLGGTSDVWSPGDRAMEPTRNGMREKIVRVRIRCEFAAHPQQVG